jgi:adenylate cyclase
MERKLAAIFSTDVQGYSRLMGNDEEATIRTLKTYRAVITTHIEHHHGRVVDSPGDNLLAEFASAVDGVKSAAAIQQELKTRNAELEDHRKMQFRIGLNVGDVIADEGRLYGDGVNIAARLEGLADPGGICISGNVHEQVRNKLSLECEYIGEREVKNIANPIRVYKVELEPYIEAAPMVSQARQVPSRAKGKGLSPPWLMAALAVGLILVVGAGVLVFRPFSPQLSPPAKTEPPRATSALSLPDKPSLAVLPFTNLSGDPEQEYFSDGMTETLITDLSKLASLFVISRNSVFTYEGQTVKPEQVSQELGVRYVLEGSVQKAADRVRITTQLIDTQTGGHVWAERYDRELQDIFALQDEITQKIVFALKVTLSPEEQARFQRAPTTNLDAYDAYLRGLELVWRTTPETNRQARQLFEQALDLDPQYAAASSYLAMTYFWEWLFQWRHDPRLLPQTAELAHQAVRLDDSLAVAHTIVGVVYVFQKRHARGIATLERALTLDPNSADTYVWLAAALDFAGRPADALGRMDQALRLNPHSWFFYDFILGFTHRLLGQYEAAVERFQKALARSPDFLAAHLQLTTTYSQAGLVAEAQRQAAAVLQRNPNFSLAGFEQRIPYQDPAEVERHIAALRKAGLE